MNEINSPEYWEVMPLEKAVNVFDKQRIPLNQEHRQRMQGEYPYCGANGVVDSVNDYLFDGEYILLAEDGGYWGSFENSAYLMSGKFWVNNHAHVLQAKQGLSDNYFLMCQLNYLDIKPFISGTTRGKLNQGMMKRVPLALPLLPEQRAIAHVLQTIQEAKSTRQREIALERERKAALMDYLFSHGTRGEPRKQTEIGEIPESWEVLPFKEIMFTGTQNGIYKSKDHYGKGSLIADMKDIFKEGDMLKIQEMDRVNLDSNELEKFSLHEGDLVFARRSFKPEGAGKCQYVPSLNESVVFSSSLIRVSLKQSVNSEFYAYFFNSKAGRSLIDRIVRVLAVSGVSGSDLKNMLIPVLSSESEQRAIAETLRTFDTKIAALEQESVRLDELFHAMLDELMTGQRSTVPLISVR